ncbi:MAG: hypothetical protein KF832_28885 [Caldilineaceae bacterium]|nr:hypothetical protein [Caldilineaceae bacterium]
MIQVDTTQWPIVYMQVDGLATVADVQEYNTAMETLLSHSRRHQERFGLVMLSDMSDEEYNSFKREKEAQRLSNAWLKANKSAIGEQCVGIAMVTKASGIMKLMKPVAKFTLKRSMGAPGDIFFTREDATGWITKQMK